jgi:hypothetical protein
MRSRLVSSALQRQEIVNDRDHRAHRELYSSRDGRASVWHAEDADGADALSDEDAAQSGDRDGVARARLHLTRVMNIVGIKPLLAAIRA